MATPDASADGTGLENCPASSAVGSMGWGCLAPSAERSASSDCFAPPAASAKGACLASPGGFRKPEDSQSLVAAILFGLPMMPLVLTSPSATACNHHQAYSQQLMQQKAA